jgi:prevent-host-death family protein
VSIYEAKTNFSKYVDLALQGDEVIVTNRGQDVIELTPITGQTQAGFGVLAGEFGDFDWDRADAEFQQSYNTEKLS